MSAGLGPADNTDSTGCTYTYSKPPKPKWAREIERFLPIKPQFLLYGNVNDVYPAELGGGIATLSLPDYIKELLAALGYALVVKYEPMIGFSILRGERAFFEKLTGEKLSADGYLAADPDRASGVASRLSASSEGRTALIQRFASRLEELFSPADAEAFFYRCYRLSLESAPRISPPQPGTAGPAERAPEPMYNPIFWIMDKENDLPAWYALDNPYIRALPVPRPDNEIRSCIVRAVSPKIAGYGDMDGEARRAGMALYRDQTSGMLAVEVAAIAQMAWHEKIPFSKIGDAVLRYKLGIQENMWERLGPEKISGAEDFLNGRVMGQAAAVRHAADILKRSRFNLSGAQFSRHSQRPKGIMFLAGPTGTGKTELARALTELIFGSSTHYIRFDMSEFSHEHANQRLIGAPPGYVGYDVGGELTNAIKQNPFSLVLFDEIEKAHPRILDMFLQILDDGRLTSGRGETVYFSESLIVFTSNLGMFEQAPDGAKRARVTPDMSYEDISLNISDAIGDFFKYRINRPEILNRIGRNIVVFDFIREETARGIFHRMMDNVLFRLEDGYGIKIRFAGHALGEIADIVCADLSMGGRGIGSNLEAFFMNPLSRRMSEIHRGGPAGQADPVEYTVRGLREIDGLWEIDME